MEIPYKEVDCLIKDEPLKWDQFSFSTSKIEKKMQKNDSNPISEDSVTCEFEFLEICTNFENAMHNSDAESATYWIQQLHIYSRSHSITDSIPNFTVPDILFIISNENINFRIECRKMALDLVIYFLDEVHDISDYFVQCNAVSLLVDSILSDDKLEMLHLSALKCLKKISNHCENCQSIICEKLPFEFINRCLDQLASTKEVSEVHLEIFSIFKNISEFQLDFPIFGEPEENEEEESRLNLLEICFNQFINILVNFKNCSNELLRISLLGIDNIINYQPREDWYHLYESSPLPTELQFYLTSEDCIIKQTTLLLIASIYRQKQNANFPFENIIKILYEDDENSSVRYYAAVALNEIIKGDKEFIHRIVKYGFLDAVIEIYDSSSFEIKKQLAISLNEIAISGYVESKKDLIEDKLFTYLIEMVESNDDEQILTTIEALDALFNVDREKKCQKCFLNSPNYQVIFQLSEYPNDKVRNTAIDFLNKFLTCLIEMIESYDVEQILTAIEALDALFTVDREKKCQKCFLNSPNSQVIFQLPEYPNDKVRNAAIDFLNKFFPQ